MDNCLTHHGIKGMKWGVRRYQNKDGSLTPEGEKRYARDKRENAARKKDNRIDVSNPDPNRWAREDLDRSKRAVDSTSKLVKQAGELEAQYRRSKFKSSNIDLSKMTDKEMREYINRRQLERQYVNMLAEEQVATGKRNVSNVLEVAGNVLAVTSSALGIALAIKDLTLRD